MKFARIYIQPKKITSSNLLLSFIYTAMLGDYILTYLGIHTFGVIEEANPLMVSVIALPFDRGLLIRVLTSLILVLMLKYVEKGLEPKPYRFILSIVLLIQAFPYAMHLMWICRYQICINILLQ
ncbi:DUF5658 family protein [Crassaminicella profunda]|uniref:DUF5658 family protein n=1 Tax=Crassaminicella profunda TaxID=1286698 RepID=UPI001CA60741|nr:DUF5658 family protein [Crassaminicella profunda]